MRAEYSILNLSMFFGLHEKSFEFYDVITNSSLFIEEEKNL